MAHPPPPKPAAAPPETPEEKVAAVLAAAKKIEGHVDVWLKAQLAAWWDEQRGGPITKAWDGRTVPVPIGEPGSIPSEVQRALEGLYVAAGWSKAEVVSETEPRSDVVEREESFAGGITKPVAVIHHAHARGLVLVLTP